MGYAFSQVVSSEDELRELFGTPSERAVKKQLAALDKHCRAFIARSPFVALGTTNPDGTGDVSPKGDVPGFVQVLDDTTLAIPDRPGNRRLDSLGNILADPRVGPLVLIPGMEETLRVNGQARLVRDEDILMRMEVQGKRPQLAIVVEVRECYLHCAKAFKRSRLWESESWMDRKEMPTLGQMIADQIGVTDAAAVKEMDRVTQEAYTKTLY
jgi:PPOX class probable FMN-dependent enzyme